MESMLEYEITMIPLEDLRENPLNDTMYDRRREDEDASFLALVKDIALYGIRQPLVVCQDGTIVSGHRRYRAAQTLGLEEVPCIIEDVHGADPDTEKLRMRMDNLHRQESFSEKMRAVDDNKALVQRILAARKMGRDPSDLAGYEYFGPIVDDIERAVLSDDNTPLRWQAVVARFVGMSPTTLTRGYIVWEAAKNGDPLAQDLVARIDSGELAIGTAYRKLTLAAKNGGANGHAGANGPGKTAHKAVAPRGAERLEETGQEDDEVDPPGQKETDDKVSSMVKSMMNGENASSANKPSAAPASTSSPKIDKLCAQVRGAINDGAKPSSVDIGRVMMAAMRQEMNDESSPGLVCLDIDGTVVGEEYADLVLRLWIRPGDLRDHAMAVRDATFSKFPFWPHMAALVTLIRDQYNETDPFRDID